MKTNNELSRLENGLATLEFTAENAFLSLLNEMEPALYNKQTEIAQHEDNLAQFQQSYKKLCLALAEKQQEIKSLRHKNIIRFILLLTLSLVIAALPLLGIGMVVGMLYSDAALFIISLITMVKAIITSARLFCWAYEYPTNTSAKKLKIEMNSLSTQLQEINSTIALETRHLSEMKNSAKHEVNQLTDKCYDFFTQRKMPQARKSLLNKAEERVPLNLVA